MIEDFGRPPADGFEVLHSNAVFGIAAAAPALRWCRGLYRHVRLRGQRARIRETQTTCSVCLDDLEGEGDGTASGDGAQERGLRIFQLFQFFVVPVTRPSPGAHRRLAAAGSG